MAAVGITPVSVVRAAEVIVFEVRTAAQAGIGEQIFTGRIRGQDADELEDLEERVRRLTAHHLNDVGIPTLADRPFFPEASPEFTFLIRAAGTAVKALGPAAGGIKSWHQARQDSFIRSFHNTAVICIDLNNGFDGLLPAAAALPLLQDKVRDAFPGIDLHVNLSWRPVVEDRQAGTMHGDGPSRSITVTRGCIDRVTTVRLLKVLRKDKADAVVVLRGRRWQGLFLNRTWVLAHDHPWARKHNPVDPQTLARELNLPAGVG